MMAEKETNDSPYSTLDCAFSLVEVWCGTRSRRVVTVNGVVKQQRAFLLSFYIVSKHHEQKSERRRKVS